MRRRRSARPRSHGRASRRPSASIRRRTCSGSATAVSSRRPTTSSASASACSASTARTTRSTSTSSATTRASTRCRRRCCGSSCATSTSGRACGARRRSATASSASATSCRRPRTSRATSTTSSSAARPSATASSRLCARRRSAARRTTCRRSTCSRRCAAGARRRRRSRSRRGTRRVTFPINRHRLANLLADAVLITLAWRLTFWLRFDQTIPSFYKHLLDWKTFAIVVSIKLVIFALFGFYNRWWRYVSTRDMWGAARGVVVASLLVDLTLYAFPPDNTSRLPRGIALIDMLLLLAFVAGSRLLARTLIERPAPGGLVARGKEVLIVGAGDAASLILRELQRTPQLGYTPIGLLDDDPRKKNLRVHGVRVLGRTTDLRRILREAEPDEVLIAIPSASGETRARIVDVAQEERVPVKTLPGLYELIAGDVNLAGQIRPVQVEDLLGREPVEVDLHEVAD